MTDTVLPLSLSQREVWRDQCAWPESAHLMIGGGGFVSGPLSVERCQRALEMLVAENDALRLAPMEDGSQRLLAHWAPRLALVEVGADTEPEQAMQHWWREHVSQPFAWDGTPPWRFAVLRAHDRLHGLVMQFHHVVMDGWGASVVMRRWSVIYTLLDAGATVPARDGPDYRQYIEESGAYRGSEAFMRDAAYWRSLVPDLPAPLLERRYQDDRRGGPAPAHMAAQALGRGDYDALVAHAVAHGATAFHYFLAALVLHYAHVCNQSSVMVGIPTLNRGGRRYRNTPGMFVGVLAIQVAVAPGTTAAELVARVGAAMRSALRHPRYPLSELARVLQVTRGGRDSPFDVLLSFEQQDYEVCFGAARRVDARQFFSGVARYPLGVTVCEFHPGQDLEMVLEGSSACFARTEVELLGRRLWHLTRRLMEQPQETVQDVPLLPDDERQAWLVARHARVLQHPVTEPYITLFERQAALQPQAVALVWDGGVMDYATLDRRASQLARRLLVAGATRHAIVAVAMVRSPDLVVSLLAIGKAGAAFLTLDPDAPLARLADILGQSAAAALLVEEAGWDRLAPLHARTLVADVDPAANTPPDAGPLPASGDLAYVLFTSGSTGRPKGVMVEHATLSRRLAWLSRVYGVQASDRSALVTQSTFDPFLIELCLPLIHGASVAVAPPGRLRPDVVADFAIRHGATIMAFVPSTLAGFLDAAAGRPGLRLRVACCGGEVLPPELAQRYLAVTQARLFNVYGPTEACIFATAWECGPELVTGALPIGAPIDDTRIYVLDDRLRPLPFGVAGEVFIGGDTLARGYLNRPELDSEVFLGDPFVPGARMYRSGDRGWLDVDGVLHFIGRLDRQVKLRGYRIELGEIEAALLAVEGVTQAVVRLVERGGRPMLQAWVAGAGSLGPESLQRTLRVRLPDYMIPGAIGVFPELPTGSAGKVDLAALPVLADPLTRPLVRGPANAMERDILALWEGVLARQPLSVQDNFFDVGGDSLDAISILTGIERLLGRKVPLYLLTEHPTVERLVAALGQETTHPGALVDLGHASAQVPLYLAASGHGDLMRFQNLAGALAGACDLHMLQPPLAEPVKRITDLAGLYADSIQAQRAEPGFVAGFSVGGIAALETARLLEQRGTPVRGLILIDTVFPKAVWGGTFYWRLFGWLVRNLRLQHLSINGRRLGAMFNDPGLVGQVMAMSGYRAGAYAGPMVLIKTSGLSRWNRMLFGSWRKLMGHNLTERQIAGLHGSIFEPDNVSELATLLAGIVHGPKAP